MSAKHVIGRRKFLRKTALLGALAKTSGSNEVGIINSLGVLRETSAAPDLAKLLSNSDSEVTVAAAEALGHIGGPVALPALQEAWNASTAGAVHDAENDGLLACANQLVTSGNFEQASKIFQTLYDHEKNDGVRQAAFRGVILSSGKHGVALMLKAIKGNDGPSQGAALQLAAELNGPATTKALANLLPKQPVGVQIALLQALAQRGDRTAVPGIAEMIRSSDPDVRLAALNALAELRDGTAALLLARTASISAGAERTAAREALEDLYYGPVTAILLEGLPRATPAMQSEIIRALGDRGDVTAAPKLLELAQGQNDSTRSAALQALALVASPDQVSGLVQLVVNATNDDARSAAADALNSACQHIESQKEKIDATTLVLAVRTAPLEARVALLAVCSGVSDPQVEGVLREAMGDHEERVRDAALRALCDSQDEKLLPDILLLARGEMKNPKFRILGIRGCVRLITQDQADPLPVAEKIETLKTLQSVGASPEAKRLVLSGLASVPDVQTLDMAASMLGDAEVKVEASDATVQIARAVSAQHPAEAAAALKQVMAKPANAAVRKSAQAALKKIKQVE